MEPPTLYVRVLGHEQEPPPQRGCCGVRASSKEVQHSCHQVFIMEELVGPGFLQVDMNQSIWSHKWRWCVASHSKAGSIKASKLLLEASSRGMPSQTQLSPAPLLAGLESTAALAPESPDLLDSLSHPTVGETVSHPDPILRETLHSCLWTSPCAWRSSNQQVVEGPS